MSIVIVSLILVVTLVLLITEKLPMEITSLAVMVVLMLTGMLTPAKAIAGFASPAPITVGVLFIVSQGLIRTGALDSLTGRLIRLSRGRPQLILALSLVLVGGFSSFLNNTPVVVLFMSVIIAICCKYQLSPSKFLMPVSFVSILAGTSTLIGTSTNILVSDMMTTYGQKPLSMFELSPLGMPVAFAGAAFLYFFSFRMLPSHKEPVCEMRDDDNHRYISEVLIPESSSLIGRDTGKSLSDLFPDIELYEIIRGDQVIDPSSNPVHIERGDVLLIKCTVSSLARILDTKSGVLPKGDEGTVARPFDPQSLIVELVIAPNTDLVGRSLPHVMDELDRHVHLLGIKRRGRHFSRTAFRKLRLAVGDILLVQAPLDHITQLRATGNFIVLDDVLDRFPNHRKAPLALGIFVAMVGLTAVGILDILVSAMSAMLLMLLTRCLTPREAFRSIDSRVLLLIIGTIALGNALDQTGAADLYARTFLSIFSGADPWIILSAFIFLTSFLSLFLSNNATAVLLLPIAIATAVALGVSPRPFIIGICFGASSCYATPIGYQTNLLVFGPGGYRFSDYLRLGLPLTIGVCILASIFIPLLWPF